MSKLYRHLMRSLKELQGALTWRDYVSERFDRFTTALTPEVYYDFKNYLRNFLLFNKLAWKWCSWDSVFSIEVFAELLIKNGTNCAYGISPHKNDIKRCRIALRMAGQLQRAYNYNCTNDRAYMYIARKYPCRVVNNRSCRGYEVGSIPDKMYTIAAKRVDDTEKKLKQEAWEYVNKYIEYIWD